MTARSKVQCHTAVPPRRHYMLQISDGKRYGKTLDISLAASKFNGFVSILQHFAPFTVAN